jgi:hypothetical protein
MLRDACKFTEESRSSHPEDGSDSAGRSGSLQLAVGVVRRQSKAQPTQLGRAAVRCSWRIYAFVVMSNHLHVVLKTPGPNLSRAMQTFLSAYANAWSRRHRFHGHVFQGRDRTELIDRNVIAVGI